MALNRAAEPGRSAAPEIADAYAATVGEIGDPVAYWRLGDAGPTILADASGNGHGGSYSGAPTFQAADLTESWQDSDGRAVDFAGAGAGTVGHAAAFALAQGSLSFWFEANALGQELISKSDFEVVVTSAGALQVQFTSGGGAVLNTINGVVSAGESHHVMVTWTGKGSWLWMDGRYVAKSTAHTAGLTGNNATWTFGNGDVQLDEIALYGQFVFYEDLQALSQFVGGLGYRDTDALDVINVSNSSALSSALSGASPGDHIVLANGTYSGNFDTSIDGTRANPIVIRSANGPGTVTISGTGIDINNAWNILAGVDIAPSSRLRINGAHSRITRVTHDNRTQNIGIEVQPGGYFSRVDHCKVGATSDSGSGTRHGIRIRVDGTAAGDCPWYTRADHCHAQGATGDLPIGTTPIVIGNDRNSMGACHVYKCFVDEVNDSGSIELKNTGGLVSHCTMHGAFYSHNRNGGDCEWRSNWYEIDHHAYGSGHVIVGCTFNGGTELNLPPGDALQEDYYDSPLGSGAGNYPASENATIIGCTFLGGAEVRAGEPTYATGVDAFGATAEGCTNWSVNYASGYSGTIAHASSTSEPYEVAVELTSADVGVAAADPMVPPGWQ